MYQGYSVSSPTDPVHETVHSGITKYNEFKLLDRDHPYKAEEGFLMHITYLLDAGGL